MKRTLQQKIYNRLTTKGKKQIAEKTFLKSFKLMQKLARKKNTKEILKLSFINTSPALYLKQIKRKRKRTIEFPFLLKRNLRLSYGIKFLIASTKNKTQNSFYENFTSEILNSSKKNSSSFKRKFELHKEAFLKKKFANYRWF